VEGSKPGGRLYADRLSARFVEFVYGVVLGWKIRSEVGLGLLFWCNSGDELKIGAMVICTGNKCAA